MAAHRAGQDIVAGKETDRSGCPSPLASPKQSRTSTASCSVVSESRPATMRQLQRRRISRVAALSSNEGANRTAASIPSVWRSASRVSNRRWLLQETEAGIETRYRFDAVGRLFPLE